MKTHIIISLIFIFIMPATAIADDLSRMYDRGKLAREKPRFERRIRELCGRAILPNLNSREKNALKNVVLEFPLVGEFGEGPMDYYSGQRGGQPFVAMPILSLIFLEDLCTAYAWLHVSGYSLETIDEYVTMLRYKEASNFPGRRYPPPLEALQIPTNALSDSTVDDLSLRFRNTAYAFILLHELGHIYYRHRGYDNITTSQARLQEQNVDAFALDFLQRVETIPMGAMLFFQAQAYFMPSKEQLKAEGRIRTDRDWEAYLRSEVTHPLTADRLRAMAIHMENSANLATTGPNRDVLWYISTRLEQVATILEDPDLQGCMAVVAHRANLSTLAPRRPRSMTTSLLERWCGKK